MDGHPLQLFSLASGDDYAKRLAARLETPLSRLEEREFEDGEHKVRPLVNVQGCDAYVIQSLYGDRERSVNDRLCRLLFLLATLKDHGAWRVTAVLPYLCYARKDRRTQPSDPVATRYVAALFEAMRTDRVIAVEVHNEAAFENAFRCETRHVEMADAFAEHFDDLARRDRVVAVSPDAGGVKRVERFRRALEQRAERRIDNAFVEKYRGGGVVGGGALVGEVDGATAVILDDIVSTGGTLLRAAHACRKGGARQVWAAATHGLFVGGTPELFSDGSLDGIVVADTVPPPSALSPEARARLVVLDSTHHVATAIGKARA